MKCAYDVPVRKEKKSEGKRKDPPLERTNLRMKAPTIQDYSGYIEKAPDKTPTIPKEDDIRRLVLFGATNSGKSATGNMILGDSKFIPHLKTSKSSPANMMQETTERAKRFKKIIKIVVTPGIRISGLADEVTKTNIIRNINNGRDLLETEPDAYLYIISTTNDIESEMKIIDFIYRRLRKIIEKIVIVFTGFDHFKDKHITRYDYLDGLPNKLKTFLANCGGDNRVLFFDNSRSFYEDLANIQVGKLLKTIDNMIGHI